MSNPKFSVAVITQVGLVAAVYAALTVLLAPFSYGAVQVRIAEALMLLCCCRKRWCIALSIGCLIANLFSGMPTDILFGTLATVIAAVLMYRIRKPVIAAFVPAVVNGLIVGAQLCLLCDMPFALAFLGVAAGEVIAVVLIGLPLYYGVMRSAAVRRLIDPEERKA
ncbi:MAG: QueT transporter family protein [Oscillospiraceae bacterium]|nr:QueT transporter family protein [Oscillospiraceae bacterium]